MGRRRDALRAFLGARGPQVLPPAPSPDAPAPATPLEQALAPVRRRIEGLAARLPARELSARALRALSDPRAVEALRLGLVQLGNAGMSLGFAAEPDARRLFEFAQWCEERAGRGAVMALVLEDATTPRGGFYQLYGPLVGSNLGQGLDPWAALSSQLPSDRLSEALEAAQVGVARLLCAMAAAALDEPPPPDDENLAALVARFDGLEIPARFSDLVAKVEGLAPCPPAPASAGAALVARARLTGGLSPGGRFVLGPYLLFLQSYLARSVVDALPTFMERVREELDREASPASWEQGEG